MKKEKSLFTFVIREGIHIHEFEVGSFTLNGRKRKPLPCTGYSNSEFVCGLILSRVCDTSIAHSEGPDYEDELWEEEGEPVADAVFTRPEASADNEECEECDDEDEGDEWKESAHA